MDKMLKPTLNFAAGRLCLVLTAFLAVTGCCRDNDTELNDETPSITTIGGTWNVKAISVSNELTYIETPPENAHHPNISITIPDTIQGDISGHTFRNTISFGFEIKENRQIDLKNYGGTRMTEDPLGRAFGNHIMFNVVKFNVSNNELQFIDSLDNTVVLFINALNKD